MMPESKTIPIRHIAAVFVSAVCTWIALSDYFARIVEQPATGWAFGAPPPPTAAFVQAFLTMPGVIAGLPLIIAGALCGVAWVPECGMVLGAAFFWYAFGWYVDCARGAAGLAEPPRIVRGYMSVLMTLSVIMLPFGVLVGLRLGEHFFATGAPPYWSEVLTYGIGMIWVSIGASFAYLRFRERRKPRSFSLRSEQTPDIPQPD